MGYRELNKFIVKNSYLLPQIDGFVGQVGNAKYFSAIDIQRGCHQIRIAEENVLKTAVSTRYGQDKHTVVPFGLINAPAAVKNIMNDVFKDYTDIFA